MAGKKWVKGYYCPSCDKATYPPPITITNLSSPKVCVRCGVKLIKLEESTCPLYFKLLLIGVGLIITLVVLGIIFSIYLMILGISLIIFLILIAKKIDKKVEAEVEKEGRKLIRAGNNKGYDEGKRQRFHRNSRVIISPNPPTPPP